MVNYGMMPIDGDGEGNVDGMGSSHLHEDEHNIDSLSMSRVEIGSIFGGLLCCVCLLCDFDAVIGWKCLFKEFPVDAQRIRGTWWIYGTNPEPTDRCYFEDLDLYWTRITQTDYDNYAVELHCSLPWFRHQMAIYTRAAEPSDEVINQVEKYLLSVRLSLKHFHLVDKLTCSNESKAPIQRWHLSRYMHLDYNPNYVKPLVVDENI
ncbi:uncharacterized protein LOC132788843 isoform X1 [Drosophila nasuta]|uniref:Uncharacterized protein LOC117569299 isoform X1 n=2 Tax=Drosophila albomicans TaxID=7291 RepID=A0A6P8X3H6_DROAB|nr:uncharacterized protein LOC117569299 isoform X1 [Drosophila albomicans]XP_060652455.1 uncharacterized protein LOC132788843 isoform X1 [Drosophila nasuta]